MKKRLALALLLATAAATPLLAWGHTGHNMINRLACDVLPEGPLKAFFAQHREYVGAHSPDPDRFKDRHRAEEGPRHYLDIDAGGMTAETYPRTWKAAVEKFGLHDAQRQGRLPWVIQDTYDALVAAFKAKDGVRIVATATWLGHYVGDAHVPFHACVNHDGADTGQKGIHAIWESGMLERNEDEVRKEAEALAAKMAVAPVSTGVTALAFEWLSTGDALAHEILAKDKGNRTSGREAALFKATGAIAERRVAEAATGLASLWLTAWTQAGKPELPSSVTMPEGIAPEPVRGADDSPAFEQPKAEPPKPEPPRPPAPDDEPF
jgi:hypothetical protein